jgi:hypothetical protein
MSFFFSSFSHISFSLYVSLSFFISFIFPINFCIFSCSFYTDLTLYNFLLTCRCCPLLLFSSVFLSVFRSYIDRNFFRMPTFPYLFNTLIYFCFHLIFFLLYIYISFFLCRTSILPLLTCVLLLSLVLSVGKPAVQVSGGRPQVPLHPETQASRSVRCNAPDYMQWVSWGVRVFVLTSGQCRYHSIVCGHKVHISTGRWYRTWM